MSGVSCAPSCLLAAGTRVFLHVYSNVSLVVSLVVKANGRAGSNRSNPTCQTWETQRLFAKLPALRPRSQQSQTGQTGAWTVVPACPAFSPRYWAGTYIQILSQLLQGNVCRSAICQFAPLQKCFIITRCTCITGESHEPLANCIPKLMTYSIGKKHC